MQKLAPLIWPLKKGNQNYVLLLEEAFQKNTEREMERTPELQVTLPNLVEDDLLENLFD